MKILRSTSDYDRSTLEVCRKGVRVRRERRMAGGGWYTCQLETVLWPWVGDR